MPSLLLLHGMAEPNPCPCVDIAPAANAAPVARLFLLPQQETILGRSLAVNGIRVHNTHVDRFHARVFPEDNRLFLEDMNSNNGTKINFVRVHQPVELRDGDLISMCDYLFLYSDANNAPLGVHTVQANEQPLNQVWEPLAWPYPIAGEQRAGYSFFWFPLAYLELASSCVIGPTTRREIAERFDVRADALRTWLAKNDISNVKKHLNRLEDFLRALFALEDSICPGQSASNPLFASVCACRDYWFGWIRELLRAIEMLAGVRLYDPRWLAWNDHTIRKMALGIRERRTFEELPILADALEEAGCQDTDVLAHCRHPEGHPGACWIIEMLLGELLDRNDAGTKPLSVSMKHSG